MVEQCFNLRVVDDSVGEPTEMLVIGVRFRGSSDDPTTTQVTIVDDDGAPIALDHADD